MAAPGGRTAAPLLCALLVVAGCGGDGRGPTPPTTPAPTTPTTARVPTLTGEPIPDVDTTAVHSRLEAIGFTKSTPAAAPGFVTTTSKRGDATVSTYGKGPSDVVKVVAEADKEAAASVLGAVARTAVKGSDAQRAETWVQAELRKGPLREGRPRTARATYGRQPYDLVVTATTATLSIGRLTG